MIVISVSKRWYNSGVTNHRGKKYWYVYFYREDGSFGSKRVPTSKVLFYKAQVKKFKKYYCKHCGTVFLAVRSKKIPQCPRCSR